MKGIRDWGLGFRFITFFFLIFTFLYLVPLTLYSTYAVDSSPSADIKSKLVELEKEIASKAAKLKQQITGKLSNKAYIGKVKISTENTITIATINGPKLVNVNQDTVFESNVKGKKYSQKLISAEDYLASLGDVDETGVLTAKKVILLKNPTVETKSFIWGQVVAISGKLISIKDRNSKNFAVSIDDSSTVTI